MSGLRPLAISPRSLVSFPIVGAPGAGCSGSFSAPLRLHGQCEGFLIQATSELLCVSLPKLPCTLAILGFHARPSTGALCYKSVKGTFTAHCSLLRVPYA